MSENIDEIEDDEENFAELFEEYSSGMNQDIQQGDRVEGEIISIGESSVYVDTGTKSDGVVDKMELLDENGELPYKAGDVVELYVVSMNESEIILSKALSGAGVADMLEDAYSTRTPVEGKVSETCKGGLRVEISGKKAFCPISQIDVRYVEDAEEHVGQAYTFLITRFEGNGKNIVVSRRDFLNIDIEKQKKEFFKELKTDVVLDGVVTKLMPYGAFVELVPGVEGMVHVSEMSWARVEKVEDALNPGDPVKVKVLSITETEGGKGPKISLSIKHTSADPWDSVDDDFHVGDQLTGKVTRCMPFGAFVEIAPGAEGLVHISEMSYTKRILKTEDAVTPGETVQVVVKDIDSEKKRISLSIRDAHGDPWNGVQLKFGIGKSFEGTVEKKERFGLFVCLEPGVTGLLPKSKMNQATDAAVLDKLKAGEKISVTVEEIDEEKRRMTLAPSSLEGKNDWKKFSKPESGSLGTMGDLLQQAFNKK
ncbi:MAG: 30S ribosomal protein S1 [Desulfobacterales bacterium]|nr:30S ribosomal protein S1 [Desulfobacterales bacterium]